MSADLYVIGDIHGCLAPLKRLLENLEPIILSCTNNPRFQARELATIARVMAEARRMADENASFV